MPIFAGQSRRELRRVYLEAWRKWKEQRPLEPLEAAIAAVIVEHPQLAAWLESGEEALAAEFTPADGRVNPFLHLAMHLALREQVATDRPAGIARIHRELARQSPDPHAAEHAMMECLAETLYAAQESAGVPDERRYLERLEHLARGGRRAP